MLSIQLSSPLRVLKVLGAAIVLLAGLSLAGQYSAYFMGQSQEYWFVEEFNLNAENNIPTYFSALLLLAASALLGVVALVGRRFDHPYEGHWWGLSTIFAFLSIDEIAALHGRLNTPLRTLLDADGLLYYTWVLPGMTFVLVFGIAYLRFFWHLPGRQRVLVALAGILYVGGALGLELVGGWHVSHNGYTIYFVVLAHTEEILEMSGIAIFVYALTEHLSGLVRGVRVFFQ